jgi:hypothetical protein
VSSAQQQVDVILLVQRAMFTAHPVVVLAIARYLVDQSGAMLKAREQARSRKIKQPRKWASNDIGYMNCFNFYN